MLPLGGVSTGDGRPARLELGVGGALNPGRDRLLLVTAPRLLGGRSAVVLLAGREDAPRLLLGGTAPATNVGRLAGRAEVGGLRLLGGRWLVAAPFLGGLRLLGGCSAARLFADFWVLGGRWVVVAARLPEAGRRAAARLAASAARLPLLVAASPTDMTRWRVAPLALDAGRAAEVALAAALSLPVDGCAGVAGLRLLEGRAVFLPRALDERELGGEPEAAAFGWASARPLRRLDTGAEAGASPAAGAPAEPGWLGGRSVPSPVQVSDAAASTDAAASERASREGSATSVPDFTVMDTASARAGSAGGAALASFGLTPFEVVALEVASLEVASLDVASLDAAGRVESGGGGVLIGRSLSEEA